MMASPYVATHVTAGSILCAFSSPRKTCQPTTIARNVRHGLWIYEKQKRFKGSDARKSMRREVTKRNDRLRHHIRKKSIQTVRSELPQVSPHQRTRRRRHRAWANHPALKKTNNPLAEKGAIEARKAPQIHLYNPLWDHPPLTILLMTRFLSTRQELPLQPTTVTQKVTQTTKTNAISLPELLTNVEKPLRPSLRSQYLLPTCLRNAHVREHMIVK